MFLAIYGTGVVIVGLMVGITSADRKHPILVTILAAAFWPIVLTAMLCTGFASADGAKS